MNGQYTVRVRTERAGWTSPPMPASEAEEHSAAVTSRAAACGDTAKFFSFGSVAGTVQIRGREVVAVEVRAWNEQPTVHHRAAATAAPAGVTINYHGPTDDGAGTEFLRTVAGLGGGHR